MNRGRARSRTYENRGLHGHQGSSELRLRGVPCCSYFRPDAPRKNQPGTHDSPADRLNGKRYHEHWLHNRRRPPRRWASETANLQSGKAEKSQKLRSSAGGVRPAPASSSTGVGAERWGVSAPVRNDLGGDLVGQFGVVAQVLLGILPALAQPEVAVVEPRPYFSTSLSAMARSRMSPSRDPMGVHHINLADPERRCDLVLDNLGFDPRPGNLLAILDRSDPPDIDPC